MLDARTNIEQQTPQPNPGLKSLEKLVGTWNVSGPDIAGRVRYEWLESLSNLELRCR